MLVSYVFLSLFVFSLSFSFCLFISLFVFVSRDLSSCNMLSFFLYFLDFLALFSPCEFICLNMYLWILFPQVTFLTIPQSHHPSFHLSFFLCFFFSRISPTFLVRLRSFLLPSISIPLPPLPSPPAPFFPFPPFSSPPLPPLPSPPLPPPPRLLPTPDPIARQGCAKPFVDFRLFPIIIITARWQSGRPPIRDTGHLQPRLRTSGCRLLRRWRRRRDGICCGGDPQGNLSFWFYSFIKAEAEINMDMFSFDRPCTHAHVRKTYTRSFTLTHSVHQFDGYSQKHTHVVKPL